MLTILMVYSYTNAIASLDFVINRFFMKLFKTNNIETVKACQEFFFAPSEVVTLLLAFIYRSTLLARLCMLVKS